MAVWNQIKWNSKERVYNHGQRSAERQHIGRANNKMLGSERYKQTCFVNDCQRHSVSWICLNSEGADVHNASVSPIRIYAQVSKGNCPVGGATVKYVAIIKFKKLN